MLKLIYAAQRNPNLSPSDFIRRWRKHGAFTMSLPNWEHALTYVQALPLADTKPEPIDAIAIYCAQDSLFNDQSPQGQKVIDAIREDEQATFATPIPEVALWVEETELIPGPFGGFAVYAFFDAVESARTALNDLDTSQLSRLTLNTRANVLPSGRSDQAVIEIASTNRQRLTEIATAMVPDATLVVLTQEAPFWDMRTLA